MKKKLGILLLVIAVVTVSCLPMSAMAANIGTAGFYNIGTAKGVEVVPLTNEGDPADIVAVYANGDDVADLLYDYSASLRVTVDDVAVGKYYAVTLVKGNDLPEETADFLYTKQVVATEKQIVFHMATAPFSSNMDLTLFITSNDAKFDNVAIPLSYAMENVYQVAEGVPLPGSITLSGNEVITATITGAPSAEHYDIVWLRNGQVVEGQNGTTYTTTSADKDATIKAKLVAKGNVFTGEVICPKGITITSGGGGLGGGGGDVPMYGIMLDCGANGTATTSTKNSMANKEVTVTVKPNEGFVVSAVTVTDSKGNAIEVKAEQNVYTFVMPKSAVTVKVTFISEDEVKPEEPKEPEVVTPVSFADVAKGSYYYDAVLWAVQENITQGISETEFAPEEACTRAQIITFLWRAAGEPKVEAENVFTDVAEGSFYYDAVMWAVAKGITAGTTETTFSPDAKVDRAQTVTFMYRMAGEPAPEASDAFTDVAPTAYYNNAVNWAVTNDITKGTGVGTFSPQDACTRGQIVTFIYRYLAN